MKRLVAGGGLVCAGFATAAVLLSAALRRAPAAVTPGLAQPLAVVTAWHDYGFALVALLAIGLSISITGYVIVLRALADDPPPHSPAVIFATAVAALALALCSPVVFSSDVYAYAAYGDLAQHGFNPYHHVPLHATDAILRAAVWQWGNPPPMCVYGPLFVALAEALVRCFGPLGASASLLALRVAACAALPVAGLLLAALIAARDENRRLTAVAAFILNPVALWSAAEGHNDALMLCIPLAGLLLARRFNAAAGAFVIGLGALVKLPAIAAAAALAAMNERARAIPRSRLYPAAIAFCAGLIVSAAVALPFERGVAATLAPTGHYLPRYSFQALLVSFFGRSGIIAALAVCGALAWIGVRSLLDGDRRGLLTLAVALWLAVPAPYPWYGMWVLPVAAIMLESPGGTLLLASTLTIFVRYIPEAVGTLPADTASLLTWISLTPALIAAWQTVATPRRALAVDPKG